MTSVTSLYPWHMDRVKVPFVRVNAVLNICIQHSPSAVCFTPQTDQLSFLDKNQCLWRVSCAQDEFNVVMMGEALPLRDVFKDANLFVSSCRVGVFSGNGTHLAVFEKDEKTFRWGLLFAKKFEAPNTVVAASLSTLGFMMTIAHSNGTVSVYDLMGPREHTLVYTKEMCTEEPVRISNDASRYVGLSYQDRALVEVAQARDDRMLDIAFRTHIQQHARFGISSNRRFVAVVGLIDKQPSLEVFDVRERKWVATHLNVPECNRNSVFVSDNGKVVGFTCTSQSGEVPSATLVDTTTGALFKMPDTLIHGISSDEKGTFAITSSGNLTQFGAFRHIASSP